MSSTPSLSDPAMLADRTIVLPPHCNTVAAEDVRVRLVLAADFDGAMRIDASGVESIGQAVIQVLVAARTEAQQNGWRFELADPSPAFVERISRCQLADAIGLSLEKEPAL